MGDEREGGRGCDAIHIRVDDQREEAQPAAVLADLPVVNVAHEGRVTRRGEDKVDVSDGDVPSAGEGVDDCRGGRMGERGGRAGGMESRKIPEAGRCEPLHRGEHGQGQGRVCQTWEEVGAEALLATVRADFSPGVSRSAECRAGRREGLEGTRRPVLWSAGMRMKG